MLLFMRAGRILDNYESFDLVSEWTVFGSFFFKPTKDYTVQAGESSFPLAILS